nr:unnamed protein product [Callosobruchus chinensis]
MMMKNCRSLWNMRGGHTRLGNENTILSHLMMKSSVRSFVCGSKQCSLYYV